MTPLRASLLIGALALSCGGAPSPASSSAHPATAEEMRALVRPHFRSVAASASGRGPIRGGGSASTLAVSHLGTDGRWHAGCADSEDAAASLVTQVRDRQ